MYCHNRFARKSIIYAVFGAFLPSLALARILTTRALAFSLPFVPFLRREKKAVLIILLRLCFALATLKRSKSVREALCKKKKVSSTLTTYQERCATATHLVSLFDAPGPRSGIPLLSGLGLLPGQPGGLLRGTTDNLDDKVGQVQVSVPAGLTRDTSTGSINECLRQKNHSLQRRTDSRPNSQTHPVLVNDVYDGCSLASILSLADVHHSTDFDKLGERLQRENEFLLVNERR